jgi:hypothetical protein
MTTLHFRKSIGRSPLRHGFLLIALACFALLPTAQAVTPAPDGGYPGNNTAEGTNALLHLTSGTFNTANGFDALFSNTTGSFNTATGEGADFSNTTASNNTANGAAALRNNKTGNNNTANGAAALAANTTGSFNTAIGEGALLNTTGSSNIALGAVAGANIGTGINNIDIGNRGAIGESSTTRIGSAQTRTFIVGISGVTVANGVGVVVGLNGPTGGQLGTTTSSERFKEAIKPMDKASEAILALKPVTFRYKHELDPEGIPQFGLVAEQVEKVNPDLVVRDEQGKVYTVRYDAVNAMLLNEFLKEHRKVEEQAHINQQQEATIAQLKDGMKVLAASLKEQASQIQKVSAQVELKQRSPQMAVNSP